MNQPTVYIVIEDSAIAYGESGEVLETVGWSVDGKPWWPDAGICDHRGSGGIAGISSLELALTAAETNARLIGLDIRRVKDEVS